MPEAREDLQCRSRGVPRRSDDGVPGVRQVGLREPQPRVLVVRSVRVPARLQHAPLALHDVRAPHGAEGTAGASRCGGRVAAQGADVTEAMADGSRRASHRRRGDGRIQAAGRVRRSPRRNRGVRRAESLDSRVEGVVRRALTSRSHRLGTYRVATAPEPYSNRLTSVRSRTFERPANSVGPWPTTLGCITNSYSSISPSSANESGRVRPPVNNPLPDWR